MKIHTLKTFLVSKVLLDSAVALMFSCILSLNLEDSLVVATESCCKIYPVSICLVSLGSHLREELHEIQKIQGFFLYKSAMFGLCLGFWEEGFYAFHSCAIFLTSDSLVELLFAPLR